VVLSRSRHYRCCSRQHHCGIVVTLRGEVIDTVELACQLRDVRVLFIGEEHGVEQLARGWAQAS